jgi:chemotaxis protein MotB
MALSTSCQENIQWLESKYTDLKKKENRSLADDNSALVKLKPIRIRSRWFKNVNKHNASKKQNAAAQAHKSLQSSYNALEKNSDDALKATWKKIVNYWIS